MANLFYARYLPPTPASDVNTDRPQSVSVKRRKTKSGFNSVTGSTSEKIQLPTIPPISNLYVDNGNNSNPEDGREKLTKKKKKRKIETIDKSQRAPEPKVFSETDGSDKRALETVLENGVKTKSKEYRDKSHKKFRAENIKSFSAEDDNFQSGAVQSQAYLTDDKNPKDLTIRNNSDKSISLSEELTRQKDVVIEDELNENESPPPLPVVAQGLVPLPQPAQKTNEDLKPGLSGLPIWMTHPDCISSLDTTPLDTLPLDPSSLAVLKNKGYQQAFAIQKAVISSLLPGSDYHPGDICISAATGSGKTLAYALPMVQCLRDKPFTRLRGLIVVPTRELVVQARETLELCATGSALKIGTAFGSKSLREEQSLLVEKGQKYDPDAYRLEREKVIDEDEELMDWDFDNLSGKGDESECFMDYVVEYTSKVDILICTPGRLVDHIKYTKGFTLNHIQWLVVDEADRLLDESFQQWVEMITPALEYQAPLDQIEEQIQKTFHLSHQRKVRKIILSATMTKEIDKIQSLKLRHPKLIVLETLNQDLQELPERRHLDLQKEIELPPNLTEIAIPIKNTEDKPLYLVELLENGVDHDRDQTKTNDSSSLSLEESAESSQDLNSFSTNSSTNSEPKNIQPAKGSSSMFNSRAQPTHGVLIFTNNNENALRLARLLTIFKPSWGPRIATLTKSTTNSSGRKSLSAFRNGKTSFLIASDRASRGLDVPDLAQVINYDMPTSIVSYVHRVGRTARAGKDGIATTLVSHHEARWFWNEIARSETIVRAPEKKMMRKESKLEVSEEERKAYEEALKKLGQEARGERA